ncbi:hypothetical protein ACPC54_38330 [Kitasatospora sp. NPDC094028]
MDPIIPHDDTTLHTLYARYSCRLLAAAAERLAAIGPAAVELDEDVTQEVWADVAAGHYPAGYYGLDGLLVLLDGAVRRVRAVRAREWPAGLPRAQRSARSAGLDLLAEQIDAAPARPLRPAAGVAFAGLRALEVA